MFKKNKSGASELMAEMLNDGENTTTETKEENALTPKNLPVINLPEEVFNEEAILPNGTTIKGNTSFEVNSKIFAKVEGNIDSSSRVVIGNTAEIKGDIKASEVIVEGVITGNVSASKIAIKSTASIKGNIIADILSVDAGAKIESNVLATSVNN